MTAAPARSYLYAPGNRGELLEKVFATGADAVILDLEDSVPEQDKERARKMVRERLLDRAGQSRPAAWVRIGALSGDRWRADVEAVVGPGLAGIRVPKAESPTALERLDEAIASAEERSDLEPGTVRVAATIETAAGLTAMARLASGRLDRLALGVADLLADIGADPEAREEIEAWLRPQMTIVSRAAGLAPPIAPAWTRLDDAAGLRDSCEAYRRSGFSGRSLIHPKQIAVVHQVFTPSADEIERSRRLLESYEAALAEGRGALVGESGEFVDAAVVRRARAVLELAERLEIDAYEGEPA